MRWLWGVGEIEESRRVYGLGLQGFRVYGAPGFQGLGLQGLGLQGFGPQGSGLEAQRFRGSILGLWAGRELGCVSAT